MHFVEKPHVLSNCYGITRLHDYASGLFFPFCPASAEYENR